MARGCTTIHDRQAARSHLQEIDAGPALAEHVLDFARIYNEQRPHETIDWALPRDRYLARPTADSEQIA
jgi:hypothetical protein